MKAQRNISPRGLAAEPRETIAYAEVLKIPHDEGLKSIATQLLLTPNDENGRLAIVKATVEVERGRFEAIGDADPGSVEERFAPHLIRVAETRAKARALRDAVNCGIVSFEELDGRAQRPGSSDPGSGASTPPRRSPARSNGQNGPPRDVRGNGQDGPMTEAQRRYLFRILAGRGYQGKAAEDFLHAELDVRSLSAVTRAQASRLIDELLHSSPQGDGRGAPSPQR